MNLRITPFKTQNNTTTPQNNHHSVRFHSQPMADTVSFKSASPTKFVRKLDVGKFPGEGSLRALIGRHKDLFGDIGLLRKEASVGGRTEYVEAETPRHPSAAEEIIAEYYSRRNAAFDKVIQDAKVGEIDNEIGQNGISAYNQFLHQLLDLNNKEFPFFITQKTDSVGWHGGSNPTGALIFHPNVLNSVVVDPQSKQLKDMNSELSAYLRLGGEYIGNHIVHDGESCIVTMRKNELGSIVGLEINPQKTIE